MDYPVKVDVAVAEPVYAADNMSSEASLKSVTKSHTSTSETQLAREVALRSCVSISLCISVALTDAIKLVSSYSMKYYNQHKYPLDHTVVVAIVEGIKCLISVIVHLCKHRTNPFLHFDRRILLPCILYALTNNIFFVALNYVSPAVWLVLIQLRMVFLLLLYRFCYRQAVVCAQWCGALVLICSVGLNQFEAFKNFQGSALPALGLAVVSSLMSAVAGVYTEVVFKSGGDEELWRMQFHLYLGSTTISIIPFLVSKYYFGKITIEILESGALLWAIISMVILFSVLHGISTSFIIKKLDNIVRFHLSALVHILTALLNKALFPDKFQLSLYYVGSVILVIYSLLLLERKKFC